MSTKILLFLRKSARVGVKRQKKEVSRPTNPLSVIESRGFISSLLEPCLSEPEPLSMP